MKIKDRPEYTRKGAVLTMPADESVATAVAVMSEKNYGAVVIVSPDDKPIGSPNAISCGACSPRASTPRRLR